MAHEINDSPDQLQGTHGRFESVARFAQSMKALMHSLPNWETLTPVQSEALDMIATKLGRILSGNSNERDHWLDIVGYAQLVVLELEKRYDHVQPRSENGETDRGRGVFLDEPSQDG